MKRAAKPVIDVVQQQNIEQCYQAVKVSWDDVHPKDPLGMEIGYRLIPMVDQGQNGELLNRIGGIRKNLLNRPVIYHRCYIFAIIWHLNQKAIVFRKG